MELKSVKGVGEKTLMYLNNAGIYTVNDLLFRFPLNYIVYEEDDEKLMLGMDTYVEGIIDSKVSMYKFRGRAFALSFYLKGENTRIKMSYFTSLYAGVKLKTGMRIGAYGKLNKREGYFSVKKVFLDNLGFKIDTEYKIKDIPDSTFTRIMKNVLTSVACPEDTLPSVLSEKYRLMPMAEYLYKSHLPETKNDITEIMRRRKYEEFFWYSVSFDLVRGNRLKNKKAPRNIDLSVKDEFISNLPFELTEDQKLAIADSISDLGKPYAMNRLIQGDVGSGKTIVAVMMALLMVKAGFQVAVMVPTEVLAIQHYGSFNDYLKKYGIVTELLKGGMKKSDYNTILEKLENGKINIIIGTHSLLNDDVKFKNLGLVVIDEQHRFGVNQRVKLIDKYKNTDSIFLSATPIPRTLGLTFFKDLDMSSIKTMPEGRKTVVTKIIDKNKLAPLMKSVENHIASGDQAYFVCPLIDENEDFDYTDTEACREIVEKYLPDIPYALIHGRMSKDAKNDAIAGFKSGKYKILISTTVIEVGINIPNATMMIIFDADRFGLATLHQLRGRVGRGKKESFCMLVTRNTENERLNALEEYSSGFDISEIDFKLRGPGSYLGEEQSGFNSELLYTSFETDLKILECAKADSQMILPLLLSGEIRSKTFDDIKESQKAKIDKIN